MIKNILVFISISIIIFIFGCSEKVKYSGKIIDDEIDVEKILYKEELINLLGAPNYIDPIQNKHIYFGEKILVKNYLNTKILKREVYIFEFNKNDEIILYKKYDLNNEDKISFSKDETKNYLIKRGLIEKLFGGVGNQGISNTSQ